MGTYLCSISNVTDGSPPWSRENATLFAMMGLAHRSLPAARTVLQNRSVLPGDVKVDKVAAFISGLNIHPYGLPTLTLGTHSDDAPWHPAFKVHSKVTCFLRFTRRRTSHEAPNPPMRIPAQPQTSQVLFPHGPKRPPSILIIRQNMYIVTSCLAYSHKGSVSYTFSTTQGPDHRQKQQAYKSNGAIDGRIYHESRSGCLGVQGTSPKERRRDR